MTQSAEILHDEGAGNVERALRAFVVRDGYDGCVVVFAKTSKAARRIGARELDTDSKSVEYPSRAPEFDTYAGTGVPNDVLLDHGWWFECYGCCRRIDGDLEGYYHYGDRERVIRLKPVFAGNAVYCCPSCKTRDEEARRIRGEIEAKAIADFRRRIARRFPDAEFVENNEHRNFNHAYAAKNDGAYGIEQVSVSFKFPGAKIGLASLRYEKRRSFADNEYGPYAPYYSCCFGDKEAFEVWASGGALKREMEGAGGCRQQ